MAERQMALHREAVRGDHLRRYELAAGRVSGNVIDLGCGTGYGSQIIAQQPTVWRVRGVDRSVEALAIARQTYAHHKALHYQIDLDLPDAFDGLMPAHWVVAFEIVEHLREPAWILRYLAHSCQRLLVSVPNEELLPFDATRFPFHHRHYRQQELRALLADCGWRVEQWMHQADAHCGLIVAGPGGRTLIAEAVSCES